MNIDELNSMKYADLFKLAREKLKITRRMPKDKLIESLLNIHQELLTDANYVSDDATDESKIVEPEPEVKKPPKRGKKRGKKSQESCKEPEHKKSKQDLAEAQPPKLDETFSPEKKPAAELNSTFEIEAEPAPKPIIKAKRSIRTAATPPTVAPPRKSISKTVTPSTVTKQRPLRPNLITPKATQVPQVSSSVKKSVVKPKAAPNFAEIHQKNFEKMQSVDEYVEKKKSRIEALQKISTPAAAPAKNVLANKTTTPTARFNFVSGLQKPVFTAKGLVEKEKQRVVATVKENLSTSRISLVGSKCSLAVSKTIKRKSIENGGGKKNILKGVRTNRRFELQMQHRNASKQ